MASVGSCHDPFGDRATPRHIHFHHHTATANNAAANPPQFGASSAGSVPSTPYLSAAAPPADGAAPALGFSMGSNNGAAGGLLGGADGGNFNVTVHHVHHYPEHQPQTPLRQHGSPHQYPQPGPQNFVSVGGFADAPIMTEVEPEAVGGASAPERYYLGGTNSSFRAGQQEKESVTVVIDGAAAQVAGSLLGSDTMNFVNDPNVAPAAEAEQPPADTHATLVPAKAKNEGVCRLSLLALIGAAIVFSGITATSQLLVHHGYNSFQVTFIRAVGLTTFTLAQLSRSGQVPVPRDRQTGEFVAAGHCILYGVMACVDFAAVFIAAQWLPLTEVTSLWSLNPIFAAIAARVWLGEAVNGVHGVGMLVFIGGAVCAMDPVTTFSGGETSDNVWLGRGLAMFGAVVSGCRIVIPRHMFSAGHVSCLAPTFWMGFMGLLLPGITSLFLNFKSDVGDDWWLYLIMLASAVGAVVGQSLLGYAMPRESGVVLGVLWNLFAVFSLFWQPVVFGIDPTLFQYISVVLVLAGGAIVGTEQQIMRKLAAWCPTVFEMPAEGVPSTDLTQQ